MLSGVSSFIGFITWQIAVSTLLLVDHVQLYLLSTSGQRQEQWDYLHTFNRKVYARHSLVTSSYYNSKQVRDLHTQAAQLKPIMQQTTKMHKRIQYKNLRRPGFVNIDLTASSTFVIVRAGLQLSFKISKLTLPAESTLQWQIRVRNTTCKTILIIKEQINEECSKERRMYLFSLY